MKEPESDAITNLEAWALFRLASYAEAGAWALLLLGILVKYVLVPGEGIFIGVAGQLHGIVLLCYFVALLGLRRLLGLTRPAVIAAAVISSVPFGTLAFGRWAERHFRSDAVISS